MIASTYWLARKISSSSLSRLQVVDQACTAAPRAMTATASATMKMIRMAPDSLRVFLWPGMPRFLTEASGYVVVDQHGIALRASGASLDGPGTPFRYAF